MVLLLMSTLIHQRVLQASRGENPKVIARMASGWAVLGDTQFLRGYCLLLPDPVVPTLNDMEESVRAAFLTDMAALGDAVLAVTGAVRINYEMLGNLEPALHAHVFPRFDDEPQELRTKPIWLYDRAVWQPDSPHAFDATRDKPLMDAIKQQLEAAGRVAKA